MYLNNQQGESLIESMIALLVISIGLLGIAALQITAMKQNNSALHHSQSVWISYDIADRIRANFGEFDNYVGIDTDNTYAQDCLASACSSTQLITSDAQNWASLVQNLPSGRGTITSPVANDNHRERRSSLPGPELPSGWARYRPRSKQAPPQVRRVWPQP